MILSATERFSMVLSGSRWFSMVHSGCNGYQYSPVPIVKRPKNMQYEIICQPTTCAI